MVLLVLGVYSVIDTKWWKSNNEYNFLLLYGIEII